MSETNGLPLTSSAMPAPVSAPAPQEQPVVHQEAPATTATAPAPASSTPPSTVAATAAAATAAVGATPMNGATSPGESLVCDWGNCRQVLPSAESLYEHICERHVGRKSTNNLNLTCQWGNCKTTTVKRDHITSHIRVHVPLKPHRCPTCGKAFKRPQDLKKHVKTHADESVIMQSPEPATRHPDMMFGANSRAYHPGHYFEQPPSQVISQGYAPGPGASYFHAPPPPQPTPSTYGNVYYTLNQNPDTNHGSYESKKRGYDALNEFFGDLKRRQFDPSSYSAVGQRLMGIQGLQLPMLNGATEYQTMPAPVAVGGGGGGYSSAGPQPASAYQLPPMSNARTKDDLVTLDQVLEQMQNTIYESDETLQASGVGQPGAHYFHNGVHYRATNSPPSQLPRSHITAPPTAAPAMPNATTGHSPSTGTPAMTPPSSAQSFTSGRSPVSVPTAHHVSPTHNEAGSNMYPRLPAATVSDGMAAGYATATSTAPPSTLGGIFDHDDRRRYTGGSLQRARPEERRHSDEMDITHSGERTPLAKDSKSATPPNIAANLIDPALHASATNDAEDAQRTAQAATKVAEEKADPKWVEKARLIDFIRDWVNDRLEKGEFEDASHNAQSYNDAPESHEYDTAMEGVESERRAESHDHAKEEPSDTVMYPTLRTDDDDGDVKMK